MFYFTKYHPSIALLQMIETLCETDQQAMAMIQDCTQNLSITIERLIHVGVAIHSGLVEVTTEQLQGTVHITFSDVSQFIAVFKDPSKLRFYIEGGQTNEVLEGLLRRLGDVIFSNDDSDLSSYIKWVATIRMAVWFGNSTDEGRILVTRMPDGRLQMKLTDGRTVNVICQNHRLTIEQQPRLNVRAIIEYSSAVIATRMLTGLSNRFNCLIDGDYAVKGFIPLIDPFEKLLTKGSSYMLDLLRGEQS